MRVDGPLRSVTAGDRCVCATCEIAERFMSPPLFAQLVASRLAMRVLDHPDRQLDFHVTSEKEKNKIKQSSVEEEVRGKKRCARPGPGERIFGVGSTTRTRSSRLLNLLLVHTPATSPLHHHQHFISKWGDRRRFSTFFGESIQTWPSGSVGKKNSVGYFLDLSSYKQGNNPKIF